MKKYLWVFLATVPLCSLANENAMNLGDSIIDVVKCESTKGEKLWVALNNLKTFTYMKNDANVVSQTIDKEYFQSYATEATLFISPTKSHHFWTIIKENAADKTGINQVTIDLRDEKGKLISHATCKRNDDTFSLLMESSFDIKEPTDKILELMDPPTP